MNSQNKNFYRVSADNFEKIPGSPIAYWVSEHGLCLFQMKRFDTRFESGGRNKTHNNERFVHCWWEISDEKKWKPYSNGGSYQKWYGNNIDVVDWSDEARAFYSVHGGLLLEKYWNCPAITWNDISSGKPSFRIKLVGSKFSSVSPTLISQSNEQKYDYTMLAFLNSCVCEWMNAITNPTLHTLVGNILQLPDAIEGIDESVRARECVSLAKADWDSFETSWDFQRHPLAIVHPEYGTTSSVFINGVEQDVHPVPLLQLHYAAWERECRERFNQLKANEEELNRIFIEIYGLQDELTPEVEDKDVTVRLADKIRDIRSFISYLIGVIMGRYSLDTPGLAYAGGEWDASKYTTYQPDDDGIVPIYPSLGMEDGLAARIIDLIKQIYGEESYYENIDFIAEALGKARNESSEETLNRYLNDGFYADHLKIYQKRPIYWLLSSGKHGGFKCLVYMHRYRADTLARINGRYFLPETTRQKYELQELEKQVASAEGRERVKLEKERQKRTAAYHEALEYGQILDHLANQSIEIDLDDGVKVNYAKFQGVELVTDSGAKVKKDLLVPIK